MAIGVLRSLTAAGIRVSEQVAVVGFDDDPGELCEPPLTTVHQPIGTLGERACDRLLKRIATPGLPPRVELLPTELVLRQSCGCPPGAPPAVLSLAASRTEEYRKRVERLLRLAPYRMTAACSEVSESRK